MTGSSGWPGIARTIRCGWRSVGPICGAPSTSSMSRRSRRSPPRCWRGSARLYAIEAEIRGHPAEHRRQVRQERSRPIVEALHAWLQDQLRASPRASDLAKAMRYAIRHWPGLVVFLDDGRIEMDTNVVERAIRPNTLNSQKRACSLVRMAGRVIGRSP